VEKVHAEIVPRQTVLEAEIQEQITVPKASRVLVASMDGVNVPLREPGVPRGRPAERPGQDADAEKQSCYKNAMVGTLSFYGDVPDEQETPERLLGVALARMPEACAVTFKNKFEQHLAVLERKAGPTMTKVFLCDGHRTLWNYADHQKRYDDYEKLIDFFHAEEHLSKAAEALFGKRSAQARAWYDKYRVKLLEQANGAAAVQRSMVYYRQTRRLSKTRQKALATEQTFFRRNQHRMDYAGFRARGLPIGSGPVEAACKSIVKTRLCRSGMRWLSLICDVTPSVAYGKSSGTPIKLYGNQHEILRKTKPTPVINLRRGRVCRESCWTVEIRVRAWYPDGKWKIKRQA